jgi:hypothetical protein
MDIVNRKQERGISSWVQMPTLWIRIPCVSHIQVLPICFISLIEHLRPIATGFLSPSYSFVVNPPASPCRLAVVFCFFLGLYCHLYIWRLPKIGVPQIIQVIRPFECWNKTMTWWSTISRKHKKNPYPSTYVWWKQLVSQCLTERLGNPTVLATAVA